MSRIPYVAQRRSIGTMTWEGVQGDLSPCSSVEVGERFLKNER